MKSFLLFAIILFSFTFIAAQNEQAPVVEKEIKYKDFTYKDVRTDKSINLRDFTRGKKLVMVVYFAPWCPNWRHEAPFAEKLYEKYKDKGFDMIGVGEYQDSPEQMKTSLETYKITFPVVLESDSRAMKDYTLHHEYRTAAGDTRKWGSPWNIFILPAQMEKKGDVVLKKAFVVSGELIEAEAEAFVREKLGLPKEEGAGATASKEKGPEVCDPDKKTTPFIKPN